MESVHYIMLEMLLEDYAEETNKDKEAIRQECEDRAEVEYARNF